MDKRILPYIIWGFSLLLLIECAKKGRPTGGPKDEDAPIMVMAKPPHYTVNFSKSEIKIYFDEFIKLDKVTEQLIVSPPLKYQPIIKPIGTASKFISIKLLDTLKPNTTYSFNFGESVVDNNEKNVLHNFKYVFSTGPIIDSLKIKGTVSDGYEKITEPYTTIMLYEVNETYSDSIIYKQKPLYAGSTLDSTVWEISNIKAGKYALVALKDRYKNYMYEPRVDKIGFYKEFIDIPGDTVFNLTLFKEEGPFRIRRPFEVSKGHAQIGYEGDPKELVIDVLNKSPNFKAVYDKEEGKDSLNYWYKGIRDSIVFKFQQGNFVDTVKLSLRTKKVDTLAVFSRNGNVLHPSDTLIFHSSIPISKVDSTKLLIRDKDSVLVDFSVELNKRRIAVNFNRKESNAYHIMALPGTFTDFFGAVNDTINLMYTTKEKRDYGQLEVTISGKDSIPLIVQLLNSKEVVVRTAYANESRRVDFLDVLPDTYSLRVIMDENNNKRWDTGSYLGKRNPEKVMYFSVENPVKANWIVKQPIGLE
ncbi:Ig-like domain-containing protein [Flavobacteriaceae bacterium F08102]|nr:Ig-like domain-containing protein [Flavobacteriaceae bacterium F08102]